jgi:hypothetical protein
VLKKNIYFLLIIFLCITNCIYRGGIRPTLNKISIIYISNWSIEQAAQIATLIKEAKQLNPTIVIVNGDIFSRRPLTDLNKGLPEIELLNNCQIDALLLSPDFLKWGIQNAQELIKKSNFSCLAANIKDKTTNQTLAQEYLIQKVNNAQISVLGVSYDSLNYYFADKNLQFDHAEFTVSKLLPILKMRSDLQFIVTQANDSLDFPVNYLFGAPLKKYVQLIPYDRPGIYKLDISYNNSKEIQGLERVTLSTSGLSDDSITQVTLVQFQVKTDSILNLKINKNKQISDVNDLNDWAIKKLIEETKTQSFLSNQPLIGKALMLNDTSMIALYNVLNEKNILPIATINGKELQKYSKKLFPLIAKISDNQNYPILTTLDFLKSNPEIKFNSIEFSNLTVWEILRNNLNE